MFWIYLFLIYTKRLMWMKPLILWIRKRWIHNNCTFLQNIIFWTFITVEGRSLFQNFEFVGGVFLWIPGRLGSQCVTEASPEPTVLQFSFFWFQNDGTLGICLYFSVLYCDIRVRSSTDSSIKKGIFFALWLSTPY